MPQRLEFDAANTSPFHEKKKPFTRSKKSTTAQMFTGGGGGQVACVRLDVYVTNRPQKNMRLIGLGCHPATDCPTIWLPFLKVALPLVSQAVWLLLCIYSYDVIAI